MTIDPQPRSMSDEGDASPITDRGPGSPLALTALSAGTYTITVAATNAVGTSAASTVSVTIATGAGTFVQRSGGSLLLGGVSYRPFFGSSNGASSPAGAVVAPAQVLQLNSVRLTDWLDTSGVVGSADRDPTRWALVDANIAALAAAGLKVVLDLSCYRNLLLARGLNPYTQDWSGFLSFVLQRVNTVSGLEYRNDPAISYVEFAGEPSAPNGGDPLRPTPVELTAFYDTVTRYWAANGGQQLRCPGGWLFMDLGDQGGIPVDAIAALAGVDILAIHPYGAGDLATGIPYLAGRALAASKPWIDEEFGEALGGSTTEASRAEYFQDRYSADDAAGGCAGEGFWNIALSGVSGPGNYDVGGTGATADAIEERAAAL